MLFVIYAHYINKYSVGWMGVDLFFVLSGFLITGRLLEGGNSKKNITNFYINRLLRIVPLYYLALFLLFVVLPLVMPSWSTDSFKALQKEQVYYWTFIINIYNSFHGWSSNITLLHFWSLSCEMQFYLLWPFLLFAFVTRKKVLLWVLSALIILAVLFRMYGQQFFDFRPLFKYTFLLSRIDSLAAGTICYLLQQYGDELKIKLSPSVLKISFFTFLLIILIITFSLHLKWHFLEAVPSVIGSTLNTGMWSSLLLLLLVSSPGPLIKFFSSNIMVWLGKYSYGVYVFHLPLVVMFNKLGIGGPHAGTDYPVLTIIISVLTSFGVSVLSYHYYEAFFLKLKRK